MNADSSRSTLYRTAWWLVIWACSALILGYSVVGQVSRTKTSRGPRALGLVELAPNGKARLIPIVILYDGQYYDAGAFKASPVPMALWSETVYEGVRTGVSQGLFTVTGALENPQTHQWLAEGTWQSAASLAAKPKNTYSPEPRGMNADEGPPVLRHSGPGRPKAPESAPAPPTSQPAPAAQPSSSPGAAAPQPAPMATPSTSPPPVEDKDRPILQRGKPAPKPPEPFSASAPLPSKPAASASAPTTRAPAASQMQLIPAISDGSGGPDFQPYSYDLRPDEEKQLRAKMLALAGDEVRARARQLSPEVNASVASPGKATRRGKPAPARPLQPDFADIQFRAFDLSSSNEPVLVLTAKAHLPQSSDQKGGAPPELEYLITLVARQDINGDFHRAFSNVTDTQHLDVLPQMELIDAVDVDGDGRGELLFRQYSDAGRAFVVYRVIGDQLYALFQGVPEP